MHRLWETVVGPTLRALEPRVIVEVGVGGGEQSTLLLELARELDGTVHLIDPAPEVDPEEWERDHGERLHFHRERSLDALPAIRSIDVALIDGDHNWYTVINELRLLERGALNEDRPPPVTLLHDVEWPYGRRDLYYDPESIPVEHRHPHARIGLDPVDGGLVEDAGVNPHLWNAKDEATPRNGVLTAIEDFLEETSTDYKLVLIPGLHGVGVLAARAVIEGSPSLARALSRFGRAPFMREHLELVERRRVELLARLEGNRAKLEAQEGVLEQAQSERKRLTTEVDRRDLESAGLNQDLGEIEERLASATGERARLAAEIQARDAELEEMVREIEAMRGELASTSRSSERVPEAPQASQPAADRAAPPDPEADVRRMFAARYEPVASRHREVPEAGGLGPVLAIDEAGVLAARGAAGADGVSADVVICVHNALGDVRRCLRSLLNAGGRRLHLIIVDDGSDQETSRFLSWFVSEHASVELIAHPEPPHGYTIAANLGLEASTADYVVLLNSDTLVTPGWLERIIGVGESDDVIGVIGPLSNAASHQSIPSVRSGKEWATNPLPPGLTPDVVGLLVDRASDGFAPRVPFINGFCYVIKRPVLETIGRFDEERFGAGFCEENDYSIRAMDAGFSLAIADRAYVHHAKSRSYGSSRRAEIAREHYRLFQEKHGKERISSLLDQLESAGDLEPLRTRMSESLGDPESLVAGFRRLVPDPLEVTFVLPGLSHGGGGGSHSVYQEARGLRELGVPASIAIPEGHLENATAVYGPDPELFRPYSGQDGLVDVTSGSDVIVATHFRSAAQVAAIARMREDFVPAYYVQDYEPFFAPRDSDASDEALLSYREIAGQLLFAKTDWLCSLVASLHGVRIAKVVPSLDTSVFHNLGRAEREPGRPLRVVAMVRPRTARRQPIATLRILERLRRELGDAAEAITFGCSTEELDRCRKQAGGGEILEHRGPLSRVQVASLLRDADIFLDASIYQAFGRTALEAMACGCVPVLPEIGGIGEYAVDGENALLAETLEPDATYEVVASLVREPDLLRRLQRGALRTAGEYSVAAAALSEYALFDAAYQRRRIGAGAGNLSESRL